jgi:hypothetical protein
MTFDEFAEAARQRELRAFGTAYPFEPWYYALGLTGDAGEIADKVKRIYRDSNGDLSRLSREAHDVLERLPLAGGSYFAPSTPIAFIISPFFPRMCLANARGRAASTQNPGARARRAHSERAGFRAALTRARAGSAA